MLPLAALLACSEGDYKIDTLDTVDSAPATGWCVGFEDGTLGEVGWPGEEQVNLESGAVLKVLAEGDDWSALEGEEQLDFDGTYALLLRSNPEGEPSSVASATLDPFVVEHAWLGWLQISEVDKTGVWTGAELLDLDGGILARLDIPPRTGGFIPGLRDELDPIEAIPNITLDAPQVGALVPQRVDMSPWLGESVSLRLLQHTALTGNGFFTVYDRICLDAEVEGEELGWQEG